MAADQPAKRGRLLLLPAALASTTRNINRRLTMYQDKPSLLPAMAAAAAQFAMLGMSGMFGYALFTGLWLVVKLVVFAAFLSYLSQVALVIMEDARLQERSIPAWISLVAYAGWISAALCVVVGLLVMSFA